MLAKICIFLVLLACRQGAATFYRHENPVTAAVQLGPLLVFLASPPSLCLRRCSCCQLGGRFQFVDHKGHAFSE